MHCDSVVFGICFVKQAAAASAFQPSLFAFPQFMSALALLAVVYTVTDIRYRFRVLVSPFPLFELTLPLLVVIGLATLLTDVWLREGWLVPNISFLTAARWEALSAALFLALAMMWIFYGYVRPPRFGKLNGFRYAHTLYRIILKGSESELPVIADELGRSAKRLIMLSTLDPPRYARPQPGESSGWRAWLERRLARRMTAGRCAHDILLMIGNRKFCRYMVSSAPGTAIEFFKYAAKRRMHGLPLGQFAKNICAEAIVNKDSNLYHEDEGYESGYFGYVKPFSEALFGSFELVESLGERFGSPLDVGYASTRRWDADQVGVYTRAALITIRSYLKERRNLYSHSFALSRALHSVGSMCSGIYLLDIAQTDPVAKDTQEKFRIAIEFVGETVKAIEEEAKEGLEIGSLRVRNREALTQSFLDHLADLAFDLLFKVATIKGGGEDFDFAMWDLQHNTAWVGIFEHHESGAARNALAFKVRRLLYDEIRELDTMPHYKPAKILGLCLYTMGLTSGPKSNIDRYSRPLHKAVLSWTRRNYLRLVKTSPDVAAACLVGSVSFDGANRRLVKAYAKGLDHEPQRTYLPLDPIAQTDIPADSG